MNARFLRDEAARFRGMAEDTDREATRLRLLAMAVDYEARAGVASESPIIPPPVTEPSDEPANTDVAEPARDDTLRIPSGRKTAAGLKETVVMQRRPVGRPRRV